MKNQTETFNRKICSTKFKQSKIQTKCEINEALNDRRMENCLQNHPCWILNCVYACTNDASNHATFRFILFTLLTRSCSVGLSVFSYSQVLLFFFFCCSYFQCSYFMCDVCALPNKSTMLVYLNICIYTYRQSFSSNEKSNKTDKQQIQID